MRCVLLKNLTSWYFWLLGLSTDLICKRQSIFVKQRHLCIWLLWMLFLWDFRLQACCRRDCHDFYNDEWMPKQTFLRPQSKKLGLDNMQHQKVQEIWNPFLGQIFFILKPLSVTNNCVGLQTVAVSHVTRSGSLRTDAVFVTEKGLKVTSFI